MNLQYNKHELLDLLYPYIQDPKHPEHNYDLAVYYHSIGQTASAVSFYIRAAERTDNELLKYECLLRASMCFESQGTRGFSTWGMLKHAIALLPQRPEAYLMLSRLIEATGEAPGKWFDGYMLCSQALKLCDFESEPMRTDVGFLGEYAVLFQKAHCAYYCGLCEESKDIFTNLIENYDMNQEHRESTLNNLEKIQGNKTPHKWKNFDWGLAAENEWFRNIVEQEVFHMDVYQKFVKVKPGDIVVDLGASVGPFTYRIKESKPSKVFCFEPHKGLYKTLLSNTSYDGVHHLNKAIGLTDGNEVQRGLFSEATIYTAAEDNTQEVETISWKTFVKENNIEHINFFKIDAEGGEYSVFNQDNLHWIKQNVDYIVGEWHLTDADLKDKFRNFRDNFLPQFENYQVFSFDEVDIKHDLFTEWFIEYYGTITIYIDNRNKTPLETSNSEEEQQKAYEIIANSADVWQHSIAPTMEITTVVPEKGCVVDCVFCPQRTLTKVYTGERRMNFDKYKQAIDKIPPTVRITFAGFVEPWMHSQCTDMVLYAHEKGHPISIFTTGVGMTIDDIEAIKHIPFAGNPNGGFVLHLPDQDRKAKHPINKRYIETVEHFGKVANEIQNFTTMVMAGDVHESVRHVFGQAPSYAMWSRAGNLIGETILKPELLNNAFNSVYHDKKMTCGCDERLYHNILLPNGDVSLCCMDYGLAEITGNLFEQEYNDAIPKPYSCYELCKYCENAVAYDDTFIQQEMKAISQQVIQG